MAEGQLDACVELRRCCCERCGCDERAQHGVDERDGCWGADGAERVQLRRAAGSAGVWVVGRAQLDWHGGRERLRGVCVGV